MSRRESSQAVHLVILSMATVLWAPSCGGGHSAGAPEGAAGNQGTGGGAGTGMLGSGGASSGGAAGTGMPGLGGAAGTATGGAGGVPPTGGTDGGYGDAGFAADFTARARTALVAGAPSWTCATALPSVAVADGAAARDAVGQFIAQVVGVPSTDIAVTVQACGASGSSPCATTFAHDTAKSGGSIYYAVAPLAQELEANATSVEETIWVPMQNGMNFSADVVMSGIADGVLVGMVVFNYAPNPCN